MTGSGPAPVKATPHASAYRRFWDERLDRLDAYLQELQAKQKKGKKHGRKDK